MSLLLLTYLPVRLGIVIALMHAQHFISVPSHGHYSMPSDWCELKTFPLAGKNVSRIPLKCLDSFNDMVMLVVTHFFITSISSRAVLAMEFLLISKDFTQLSITSVMLFFLNLNNNVFSLLTHYTTPVFFQAGSIFI